MENNYSILQIMQRYGISNSYDMLNCYEEFKKTAADPDFIFTLLRAFDDERDFPEAELNKFSMDVIIDYIHKTHQFYLTRKLLEIEQSIGLLLQDYSDTHPLLPILNDFYLDYKHHLGEHIAAEEESLLPYIGYLQQVESEGMELPDFFFRTSKFSLERFIRNHHDSDTDIQDVCKVILKYDPPKGNQTPYRILLSQLRIFEKDLAIHGMIEDLILVPRAQELEQMLMEKFRAKTELN